MTDYSGHVIIDYTNYRGERSTRRIRPNELVFGQNAYHTTPQWLLVAVDIKKNAIRTFAMKDIHSWKIPVEIDQEKTR